MPGPESRIVTSTRLAIACDASIDVSIRPAPAARVRGVFGVDQDVEERLLEQQRIADHARHVLFLGRGRPRCRPRGERPPRLANARDSMRSTRSRTFVRRRDPVKTRRLRTIFAARSASVVDPAQRRSDGSGLLGRLDQQLEMSEHALQRVVHLVRDAGDELAERGELFGLREPLAAAPRARSRARVCARDVARDDDASDRDAVLVDQRRDRHGEDAAKPAIGELLRGAGGRASFAGPRRRVSPRAIPPARR